jgi:serine/threonine protein kinase/tetratricopeptide (TPR) repeat protein
MTEPSLPEESIFAQALEITATAERAAFLDRACADNPALRAEVEALLRAHDRSGDLLDVPDDPASTSDGPAGERPGAVIGHYKLLEHLGEGGMGTVWMADQTDPIQRRVAVKVVKEGMDSKHVLARFEAERQALALMEHPNIARVLDAGRTPSGRPYFVMELVKGRPITKHCDEKRLGVRERLELFGDVCRAVQHAHQKGVIHRDIKPSNVLVAPFDGKPVVKVIDFGLAKATGRCLTEQTLFTGFGAVVGTPEHMSPEQAEVNNQDIDTRSDIYSLGVLLYELLTGSTPLTRKRAREAPLLEVLRLIREEEPPRPSTRLLESKETLVSISAQRHTEPARLTRLVRGELDWIVMRALEKDRSRRYETANGFALDIERYLADEPVQACPPSAAYRIRKFVRRHKGPVLVAGIFAFLLVAGTVGTTTGLLQALAAEGRAVTERDAKEEARRQTLQALNAMTDEVVEDLMGQEGVELTDKRRDFLKTVLAYHAAFPAAKADDAEGRHSRAQGCFRVGRIRHRLGDLTDAAVAYGDAITQEKQLVTDFAMRPDFQQDLATSQARLGEVLAATNQPEEAKAAYRAAVRSWQRLVGDFPRRPEFRQQLADCHLYLGHQLRKTGGPKEAETAYRNALKVQHQLVADFGPQPEFRADLAVSYLILGHLLRAAQRRQEADEAAHTGLVLFRQLLAEGGPSKSVVTRVRRHFAIITGDPTYLHSPWYPHAPLSAGIRPGPPKELPEAERQSWQKLWHDVADMLQRAADKTGHEQE